MAENGLRFRKIYSSDLQRALKTATAIRLAQPRPDCNDAAHEATLQVTALAVLREQDFGFYEGKPFYARSRNSSLLGKENHRSQHQDDPDFKDAESKESMALRVSSFLQNHLVPAICGETMGRNDIVVVSHGIILSQLWRCFLKLIAKNSITLSPGLSVGTGGVTPLEYLGGWSNTGYLELEILKKELAATSDLATSATAPPTPDSPNADSNASPPLHQHKVVIRTVNGKEHLKGLKRIRGVGSSKFDEGQKSIDSFFKKRKV